MKEKYLYLVKKSFRVLRHRKLRNRPWWRAMTSPMIDRSLWIPCRDTVAAGLAIGMFFSMIVILPFQMLFAGVLAMRFKVNVPFALLACWISNVFTTAPLAFAQAALGEWVRNTLHIKVPYLDGFSFNFMDVMILNLGSFFLGMMIFAVGSALLSYPLVHLFSVFLPNHLPVIKRRQRLKEAVVEPGGEGV